MRLLSYLTSLSLIVSISSCDKKEEKKEEVLRPVKYETVGTASGTRVRTFNGVAKAGDEVALSFRSGGIITQVNVSVGDRVRKGSLIAKLDNVEANLALEQSISSLNSALSDKNTAENELERVKTLYERNSVSLSDYQATRNSYQIALSQYESALRNKGIQETQVSYGYIYAPKDGTIASTDGGMDESVSGGHEFAILNAGEGIQIQVGLPESVINQVNVGMAVNVAFPSIGDEPFAGSVVEVAQVVGEGATYQVKIEVLNPQTTMRPGMATTVTFIFGERNENVADLPVIPLKAVGEDGNGNFVFVLETEDNNTATVKKRKVTVGELTVEGFQITDGLSEGEKIATAGLQSLFDGQKVSLQ